MKPQDVEHRLVEIYGQEAAIASDFVMLRSRFANERKQIVARGHVAVLFFFFLFLMITALGFWSKNIFILLGGIFPAFFAWYVWKTISPFKGENS
jgi:hypothetical protein